MLKKIMKYGVIMKRDFNFNPKLDLVLERVVDISVEQVWQAWTNQEHIKKWFAPKPWRVETAHIDFKEGGAFDVVMKSPTGEKEICHGCILEIKPRERLIWTDALCADYRPTEKPFITAIISLAPSGRGTRYTVIVKHKDEATKLKHEEMGFESGWSQCLDQLVTHMREVAYNAEDQHMYSL